MYEKWKRWWEKQEMKKVKANLTSAERKKYAKSLTAVGGKPDPAEFSPALGVALGTGTAGSAITTQLGSTITTQLGSTGAMAVQLDMLRAQTEAMEKLTLARIPPFLNELAEKHGLTPNDYLNKDEKAPGITEIKPKTVEDVVSEEVKKLRGMF